jgi:Caspase domain
VILRLLRKTGARRIVLFLDACRAVITGGRGIECAKPPINVENLSSRGLVSFCSCEPGKLSYESPKIGSGLFTKALCDALGEQGKCVAVQEISYYLKATMPEMARQLGTPLQLAYTRVEALQLQTLAIAAASYRLQWRTATSVGQEIRHGSQLAVIIDTLPDPILAIDFGTSSSATAVTNLHNDITYVPSPRTVPNIV